MFLWVRSTQAGGGHSAWHVLHSQRMGPSHPFALTACGFSFDDFQIQPATRPLHNGGLLILPASHGTICNGCTNFAQLLATTAEI